MFLDRIDAGKKLGEVLALYKGKPVVVYALPRGGVVTAKEVATALLAPLDLIVVRKIGHPLQPEYAIGVVAEDGYVIVNRDEVEKLDESWFERAVFEEQQEAQRRRRLFLQGRPTIDVRGKTAIIVDDGLATGLTMKAAIHEIRQREPRRIVVAVPVGAADTVDSLRADVDHMVVLYIPERFGAVGNFYSYFDQVTDDEVVSIMKSLPPVEFS